MKPCIDFAVQIEYNRTIKPAWLGMKELAGLVETEKKDQIVTPRHGKHKGTPVIGDLIIQETAPDAYRSIFTKGED